MFSQMLVVAMPYTLFISICFLLDGSGRRTDTTDMVTLAVFVSSFVLTE